jgi:seryl-tRNA synthetase
MLDLKYFIENEEAVKQMLADRGSEADIDGISTLTERRRQLLYAFENKRAEQNKASKAIGEAKKKGEDTADAIAAMKAVADEVKELQGQVSEAEGQLDELLLAVPNMPHSSVPAGADEEDNQFITSWGEPREFDFPFRPHWEVGEILGIVDVELGAKLAGSSFVATVGAGALLERALMNLMLDEARKRGYTEVNPPYAANSAAMTGTGQLPKFGFDMYRLEDSDLWLIPTAEVPLTNVRADEILQAEDLPIYLTAYTPCFRREAGAAGRDTRGMMRVHQFNKVELVKIVHPDTSYDELEKLLDDSTHILQLLDLHYRVVNLCTGDLTFSAAKTLDVEVWLPGEEGYREISSCSNYENFQARRMNTRFRPEKDAKPQFVHTLNGSALAIGRTVIAILENYQNKDGSVTVPEALRPYMGGMDKIT